MLIWSLTGGGGCCDCAKRSIAVLSFAQPLLRPHLPLRAFRNSMSGKPLRRGALHIWAVLWCCSVSCARHASQEQWKHEKEVQTTFQTLVSQLTDITADDVAAALKRRVDNNQAPLFKHSLEMDAADITPSPQFLQPQDAQPTSLLCVANKGYPVGASVFLLVQVCSTLMTHANPTSLSNSHTRSEAHIHTLGPTH